MAGSKWCGNDNEVWFDSYGPSECLCYTSILVPSLIVILYLFCKYAYEYVLKADEEYYASSSRRLLYGTMALFIMNPVLFSAVSFVGADDEGSNVFPAKVVGVSVNILAWAMCAFSIYYDFKCRMPWPCAGIRYYLFAEVLSRAVTISSIYSSQASGLKLTLGTLCFVVTLTLLVMALFKEKFSMICESRRFGFSDVKNYADDDIFSETADSFTSANINVSFHDNANTSRPNKRRVGFFSFSDTSVDAEAEEGLLGRCSDLSDSSYYAGHYRDSEVGGAPPFSWRAHGREEQSHVQSIMERNLQSNSPGPPPALSGAPPSPLKDGLQHTPSTALARVMRHSSRSTNALSKSASGMVGSLSPQGQVPRQSVTGGVGMGMRAKDIIQSSEAGAGRNKLDDLQIRMGKYGFRRENSIYLNVNTAPVLLRVGEADSDTEEDGREEQFPTRLSSFDRLEHPREVRRDGSVNRPKLRDDLVSYKNFEVAAKGSGLVGAGAGAGAGAGVVAGEDALQQMQVSSPSGLMMEAEFEILFQLTDAEGDEALPDPASDKDGDDGGPVPQQWSVWRTGKELLALHAVLVGMLGDLAPRRPKITLVGPQPDTSAVSRESILTDTRVMGGYLRALVSQSLFHCPELCLFCDIPLVLVPPPAPRLEASSKSAAPVALSRDTSASNMEDSKDQWRRIFLNLRKNLKPKEVAVRCRVYDGVVCGKDITKWLLTSSYKYAHDYTEAHRIAQGLLEADLLTAVCAGYDHTLQLQPRESEVASRASPSSHHAQSIETDIATLATFKSHPSYIYRYPKQSGANSGISAFTMFAHRVETTVPCFFSDDSSPSSVTSYTVRSCLLDEQWEVFRRFNEFSQFHKTLQKEGIKPAEAFPTTSFSMLLMGQVSSSSSSSAESKLKERAAALEVYLSSAIEAIQLAVRDLPGDSYSDVHIYSSSAAPPRRHRLLTLLAEFLDDEHTHLRLCCRPSSSASASSSHSAGESAGGGAVTSSDQVVEDFVDSMVN